MLDIDQHAARLDMRVVEDFLVIVDRRAGDAARAQPLRARWLSMSG
jgi:hypothetical protein